MKTIVHKICNSLPLLRSSQGFTLMEMVMATALAGLLALATYSVFSGFTKTINQISEEIETSTDIESGLRILLNDLKNVDPSFGSLDIKDDQGSPLMEYFPDVPEAVLVNTYKKPASRSYTLKLNGGFREIVLLLHDPSAHEIPSMVYDPARAYDITPAVMNNPGTVTFRTVNKGFYIGNPSSAGTGQRPLLTSFIDGKLVTLWPGYWRKGQLLMFDTPLAFRSEGQTSMAAEAPRSPFYVGRVLNGGVDNSGGDFIPLDPSALNMTHQTNFLKRTHPVDPTYTIDTADKFFRSLPSAGGGQPMVRLRPVRLVKYFIEPMYPDIPASTQNQEEKKKLNLVRLWKWTYSDGSWNANRGKFLIAEKLKAVRFIRTSVTDKSLQFTISRTEL